MQPPRWSAQRRRPDCGDAPALSMPRPRTPELSSSQAAGSPKPGVGGAGLRFLPTPLFSPETGKRFQGASAQKTPTFRRALARRHVGGIRSELSAESSARGPLDSGAAPCRLPSLSSAPSGSAGQRGSGAAAPLLLQSRPRSSLLLKAPELKRGPPGSWGPQGG